MTEWQLPAGSLEALAAAVLWSGSAGVSVGVACADGRAELCTLKSAGAWLVTSGAATNK